MGRYNSGNDVCECGVTFAGSETGLCHDCHVKKFGDDDEWQEPDDDDRLPPDYFTRDND